MVDRYCPDCDVLMEQTGVHTSDAASLTVETDRDGGVLDRLGVGAYTPLHAVLCPECGLTRLYADLSE